MPFPNFPKQPGTTLEPEYVKLLYPEKAMKIDELISVHPHVYFKVHPWLYYEEQIMDLSAWETLRDYIEFGNSRFGGLSPERIYYRPFGIYVPQQDHFECKDPDHPPQFQCGPWKSTEYYGDYCQLEFEKGIKAEQRVQRFEEIMEKRK